MNILSFDIEDWWGYRQIDKKLAKDSITSWLPRLNNYLHQILDFLDEKQVKATFFCLGEVAAANPEVIKQIDSRGHHIGSHSYSHTFWMNANYKQVADDTHKAVSIIEDLIGKKVDAYRAPAFSINENNKWIFEILAQNGIVYDCSIFPTSRGIGGFKGFTHKTPVLIEHLGVTIKEFPIAPVKVFGKEIVYSGGGYFRLFPYWKIKYLTNQSNYMMTYFHIKDFDKDQERYYRSFAGESAPVRYFKNYFGLNNNFLKFKRFISEFDFLSVKEADLLIDWNSAPKVKL